MGMTRLGPWRVVAGGCLVIATATIAQSSGAVWDFPAMEQERIEVSEKLHQKEEEAKAAREERLNLLTENLAEYTRKLYTSTAVLAGLTAGLVIFSFFQVYYARRAIQEAARSGNIAERALTELERPWMIDIAAQRDKIGEKIPAAGPLFKLVFKNVGRAPAVIYQCRLCTVLADKAAEIPDYTEATVMGITGEIAQSNEEIRTVPFRPTTGTGRYLCYGVLEYRSLGGTAYETGFAVEFFTDHPRMFAYPIAVKNYTYQR